MFDLRTILRLDALASGGLGALLLVASPVLDGPLGLPVGFSLVTGGLLVAWAGFVVWVSMGLRRAWVAEVVALNAAYVVASVVVALADWLPLTGLGVAFVLVQAVAVLGLTVVQAGFLRAGRVATA